MNYRLLLKSISIATGIFAISASVEAETYLGVGLPFFPPYEIGQLDLESTGTIVAGTLSPPRGLQAMPIKFTGVETRHTLTLNFLVDGEAVKVEFIKASDSGHVVLTERWPLAAFAPQQMIFSRPRNGNFDEQTLAVGGEFCRGRLNVVFDKLAVDGTPALPASLSSIDVRILRGPGSALSSDDFAPLGQLWPRLRTMLLSGSNGTDLFTNLSTGPQDYGLVFELHPGLEPIAVPLLRSSKAFARVMGQQDCRRAN